MRALAWLRRLVGRLLGYEQELSRMRLVCDVLGQRMRFPGAKHTASGLARELHQFALLNTPAFTEVSTETRAVDDLGPGCIRIVVEHPGVGRRAEGA